ncbi:AI-2E family transporter [Microvirga sp. GCM10011540]|uniref:AI-2E family transporter n=1 Tax=Microvirga sp. GCM10011540 TaxID=3317338 RepID=UPI0036224067
MPRGHRFWNPESAPSVGFVQHVLVVAGILSLIYLLWQIRSALLLVLAGVIVAVLLVAAAEPIRKRTKLSRRWSLGLAGGAICLVLALSFWLVGSQVQSQLSDLASRLPQALQSFEDRLAGVLPNMAPSQDVAAQNGAAAQGQSNPQAAQESQADRGGNLDLLSLSRDVVSRLTSFGATALEVLANLVLVIIAGVFFAADPGIYRRGIVKLFPPSQHERVDETLGDCGGALRNWLIAELIAMALVAVLVGLGTWIIGLPAPLALALFAGLMEFIPIVGPILGAVPALLLALTQGTTSVLWTLLLFLAIQQLESNVITPLVQRRMVSIPPALLLFAVLAFGLLFGPLGVVVAAPLTVVVFVAVKKLYIRDTLHEATPVPGEK